MSKTERIGGLIGILVTIIPLVFCYLAVFSSGAIQMTGIIVLFLCFMLILTRDFKEWGAAITGLFKMHMKR